MQTIKLDISDKLVWIDTTNLIEKKGIVKSESETAEILNKFFSNLVKNFDIPLYDNFDPVIQNMKDLVFKAILNYKNDPSILAIRDTRKNGIFCFKEVTIEEIEREGRVAKRSLKIVIFIYFIYYLFKVDKFT